MNWLALRGCERSILSYFWATEKKTKISFRVYDDDDYLLQWRSENAFLSKSNEGNRETLSIIEGANHRQKRQVAHKS